MTHSRLPGCHPIGPRRATPLRSDPGECEHDRDVESIGARSGIPARDERHEPERNTQPDAEGHGSVDRETDRRRRERYDAE